MSVSRVRERDCEGGKESSRGGEGARGGGRGGGGWGEERVSVQFTDTTVNSEAGQDTERGGVRKKAPGSRMPLKCSTHASVQKNYKLCIFAFISITRSIHGQFVRVVVSAPGPRRGM